MAKVRADVRLVELDLVESREKAKRLILAGLVRSQNSKIDKPGEKVDSNSILFIKNGHMLKYVSRGGFKLEKAIEKFNIDLKDKNVLDIGSSTGGFTDCALQNGAKNVIALDVGTNQLHYSLRENEKVTVMENTNFRNVTKEMLPFTPDIAVCDVSFISLEIIFKQLTEISHKGMIFLPLIKPQFEVGREVITEGKGLVKNEEDRKFAIRKIISCAENLGWSFIQLDESPIKGNKKGNIEYISHFIKE